MGTTRKKKEGSTGGLGGHSIERTPKEARLSSPGRSSGGSSSLKMPGGECKPSLKVQKKKGHQRSESPQEFLSPRKVVAVPAHTKKIGEGGRESSGRREKRSALRADPERYPFKREKKGAKLGCAPEKRKRLPQGDRALQGAFSRRREGIRSKKKNVRRRPEKRGSIIHLNRSNPEKRSDHHWGESLRQIKGSLCFQKGNVMSSYVEKERGKTGNLPHSGGRERNRPSEEPLPSRKAFS